MQIKFTEDELRRLEQIADEYGFETPEDYVKSIALEPTREELLDDIKQGLEAIKRGDPMPTLDEMWAEVESDDGDTTD